MTEQAKGLVMLDAELTEIVANLRVLGADIADVEEPGDAWTCGRLL